MRWMASPTQWTWVWVSSKSRWWKGSLACCSPWGRKESRVRHDWVTELLDPEAWATLFQVASPAPLPTPGYHWFQCNRLFSPASHLIHAWCHQHSWRCCHLRSMKKKTITKSDRFSDHFLISLKCWICLFSPSIPASFLVDLLAQNSASSQFQPHPLKLLLQRTPFSRHQFSVFWFLTDNGYCYISLRAIHVGNKDGGDPVPLHL